MSERERQDGARDDIARKCAVVDAIEAEITAHGERGPRWAAWTIYKLRGKEQRLRRRLQQRATHALGEMPAGGAL